VNRSSGMGAQRNGPDERRPRRSDESSVGAPR
jgi:hypothetical protein